MGGFRIWLSCRSASGELAVFGANPSAAFEIKRKEATVKRTLRKNRKICLELRLQL